MVRSSLVGRSECVNELGPYLNKMLSKICCVDVATMIGSLYLGRRLVR